MDENVNRLMQDLKPTVWIGKQGCTPTMIEEIIAQLKKRKMIKVKWLQSTEVDPGTVALQAKARLIEVRGRTMILAGKEKVQKERSADSQREKISQKTRKTTTSKRR